VALSRRLLILLAAGCVPDPGASPWDPAHDWDGDGLSEQAGDCDDQDDTLALGAWYADQDLDGYGATSAEPLTGCAQPEGAVAESSDCDDGNALVGPGRPESCLSAWDDDCSGGDAVCAHEGDESTVDADATWTPLDSTDGIARYVAGAGDVDGDGIPEIAVGAEDADADHAWVLDPVLAGGGVRSFDEIRLDVGVAGVTRSTRAVAAGDLDGDGIGDLVVSAYADWNEGDPSGSAGIMYGPFEDGRALLGDPDSAAIVDGDGEAFGYGATMIGDTSGDGAADLAVGAPAYESQGRVLIFEGDRLTRGASVTPAGSRTALTASIYEDHLGTSIAKLGDLDGDGLEDWAAGTFGSWEDGWEAFVIAGGALPGGDLPVADIAVADVTLESYAPNVRVGLGLDSLDANGDGLADLVVGGWGAGVFVVLGPPSDGAAADLRHVRFEHTPDTGFGASLAVLGDADGDALPDLAVGAPAELTGESSGVVYVLPSWAIVSGGYFTLPIPDLALRIAGTHYYASAGLSVGAPGDVDGDGAADLVVSEHDINGPSAFLFLLGPE
jgi:hypothetical protein